MVKKYNNSKIGDYSNRRCCALDGKNCLCFGVVIARISRSVDFLNNKCVIFFKFSYLSGILHRRKLVSQ